MSKRGAQQHDERITRLESSVAAVTDLVGRLATAEINLVERTQDMGERVIAGFQELRALHADTEYKLNALIDTVDQVTRRNGHKE